MRKKPFKIVISPSGDITYVHSDKLALTKLGTPFIEKATYILFNNEDKFWSVLSGVPVFSDVFLLADGFRIRADAISWEIDFLHKHMEEIIEAYPKGGYTPGDTEVFRGQEAQI